MSIATARTRHVSPALVAGIITLAFAVVAASAMTHTSATFDEIVFLSVGARGFHTGDFSLVTDHPRLPQYLYGLPAHLSSLVYPSESVLGYNTMPRYIYSRELLWGVGNPAEAILMRSRLVAIALGTATVWVTFLFARRHMAPLSAVLAALLVASLPDMLAHTGVAYNDIALAFGFLVSLYALDAVAREPTPGRAALAGLAVALTVCVKYSGIVLFPIAATLFAIEALAGRWQDRAWRRSAAGALAIGIIVAYVTIVLLYLGDWRLSEFTNGLIESFMYAQARPAFLLGEHWVGGRWYYFPVVFLLKTPVAFHILAILAAIGAWASLRGKPWREWLTHGARAPATGVAFFVAGLVTSQLNIGFRHALPMLPALCILVAQGLEPLWARGRVALRVAMGFVVAAGVISALSMYPYFIGYTSEYVTGRLLSETVADSSTDWGQGLVGLRDFMRERGVREVALGYVGSAVPLGYGIRYVPMPSYYTLSDVDASIPSPRYLVVSAGLLAKLFPTHGQYDYLRGVKPVAVVGGSMYVFDQQAKKAQP